MTVGLISEGVFGDIANAIREQNGTATTYKPSEMAAAVTALDGTNEGNATTAELGDDIGVISETVFSAIADAIRGQNGLTVTYKPGEMAQAIRDLTWGSETKVRALLLDDGTFELNYLDSERANSGSSTFMQSWDVDTDGYSASSARPWDGYADQATSVYIDSSMADAGLTDISYFFQGFSNVTDVHGLSNLNGITKANYAFAQCPSLQSIWAAGFDNSTLTSATSAFYGDYALVGGHCTTATNTAGVSTWKTGAGGLLVDSSDDGRNWIYAYIYSSNASDLSLKGLFIAPSDAYDIGLMVASGGSSTVCKLVGNARYSTYQGLPWASVRSSITEVSFLDLSDDEDHEEEYGGTGSFGDAALYLDYWFSHFPAGVLFSGLRYISPASLYMAFASGAWTTLDLSGLDPSSVTDWRYAFGSMASLTTIKVDSTWTLPSGLSSTYKANCFYGDTSLVGGNGTAFSSSNTSADYAVIDSDDTPGYLTAG